jgi:hypothetical protein
MDNPKSYQVAKRLITPLAVWAMTKLLESKKVQGALQEVDARAYVTKRNAARVIRKRAHHMKDNRVWLAAGAAAFVVGIGLMARATKK